MTKADDTREFVPPSGGWWRRACFTPVGDALRGKLSGRLDVRRVVADGNLPGALSLVIYELACRARVPRAERVELTRQLVERATQELSAGRAAGELAVALEWGEQGQQWLGRVLSRARLKRARGAVRVVAAADLPAELESLVLEVVRGTRLWRREQLDVAQELVAHFADGLAAGRSGEQLAADFGSASQAARLIRLAKIRGRSRIWHAYRLAMRTLLALLVSAVVGYLLLTARFWLGQPNVAVNYWTELNAGRRAIEAERAWPLYRAAVFELGKADYEWLGSRRWDEPQPGEVRAKWQALLERHAESLRLAREAAARPEFGYLLGDPNDAAEAKAAGVDWLVLVGPTEAENRDLYSASLEGIQALRAVAWLLEADAMLAAEAGQANRVEADVAALLGLAEQLFGPSRFLVEELVGLAVFELTLDVVGTLLRDHPGLFDESQLRNLAHRMAGFRGGVLAMNLAGERTAFDDLLQRIYTDDGHGDGRVTRQGLELLNQLSAWGRVQGEWVDRRAVAGLNVSMPGIAGLIGGRRENRERYNELLDGMIAAHQGPPWAWNGELIRANRRQMEQMFAERGGLRYALVRTVLPAVEAVFAASEKAALRRDATLVALALRLWHQRHGAWPERLDQLVPDYLPSVPADRADGQPLRYVVRDGKPVVYSIGFDRQDDGGRAPSGGNRGRIVDFARPEAAELARIRANSEEVGDWILWPPVAGQASDDQATP